MSTSHGQERQEHESILSNLLDRYGNYGVMGMVEPKAFNSVTAANQLISAAPERRMPNQLPQNERNTVETISIESDPHVFMLKEMKRQQAKKDSEHRDFHHKYGYQSGKSLYKHLVIDP